MPNSRIAQARSRETILECRITAYPHAVNITADPHAVNYWEKDGRRVMSSARHRIEAYDEGSHTITLSLRIYITDDDIVLKRTTRARTPSHSACASTSPTTSY